MANHPRRLTASQKKLLRKHYGYYRALDCGTRSPANGTEEHFVTVCRGMAQPITEHEVTYGTFKRYIAMRGLAMDEVETTGSEPIPDVICQPGAGKEATSQSSPAAAEGVSQSQRQVQSTEAYDRYGRQASESPPGFIYKDNRYGNRRWNS